MLDDILRTKIADHGYEGAPEDLELKHFHFHITTEVTVKGTGCPKIDTDVFGDVIHDFVKRGAVGRRGRRRRPAPRSSPRATPRARRRPESDLAAPFNTMTVGACTEGKTEDGTKMHSFEVSLVVTREDPSTNPHPAMDALKNVFSTSARQGAAREGRRGREDDRGDGGDRLAAHRARQDRRRREAEGEEVALIVRSRAREDDESERERRPPARGAGPTGFLLLCIQP